MKKFLLPLLLVIVPQILFAQMSKKEQGEELRKNAKEIRLQENSEIPDFIKFCDAYRLAPENAIEYSKSFFTSDNVEFVLKNSHKNKDNKLFYRYFQTIDGYPVEFTSWHVHVKNDRVFALNGDIVDIPNFEPVFLLSETEAFQAALNYIGADVYMWQDENEEHNLKLMMDDNEATYYPEGIKVITPVTPELKNNAFTTAYKFNIYSIKPYDRKMVYVDAQTGDILFDLPLIHHSNEIGIAHTQYSGIQEITTQLSGSQYILRDYTRGNGIVTLNCQNTASYGSAINFFDDDNVWNNVNPQLNQYAPDAHFGTISYYDYLLDVHGRNSINGNGFQLWSYVHFNLIQYGYSSNVNAFWNGQCMTYGDGNPPSITPLTTLDICGHEVTHGLTEFSAGLIYNYVESGALNEGFSDIFGTALEFYAYPQGADWTMGEKMGLIIRSMSNPKAYGCPNTYQGTYWSWMGQMHTNSGPLSYWFYLLSEGGSGTNDKGYVYSVDGISIENAEQIAFKLLTEYLTPTSGYSNASFLAKQAAIELFGDCSPETKAVVDGFYAIGVITAPYNSVVSAAFSASQTEFDYVPAVVTFTNNTVNGKTYLWDFGDGNTSTEKNPVHTYTNFGSYTVTLFADGDACGTETLVKENYIVIDNGGLPIADFSVNTQESCTGFIIFTDESLNSPDAWEWDFGDGNTSSLQNPTHQYNRNGLFTIVLKVSNALGEHTVTKNLFISIEMPEAPEIEDIKCCINEEFEIELNLEGVAYWYKTIESDEPVHIGNIWSHPPVNEIITYFLREITEALEGSVEEYCASYFTEVVIIPETCVSVSENQIANITIAPNPSNGLFYIKGLMKGVDYRYVVTDISGKTIIENQLLHSELVDLSKLPDGVYFITISTSDSVQTYKLMNVK